MVPEPPVDGGCENLGHPTFVEFSPGVAHHPDVVSVSTTSVGVWMRACLWAGRNRTGGVIPDLELRNIAPRPGACKGLSRMLSHDPSTNTWSIVHWGELVRPSGHYRSKIPAKTRQAVYTRDNHACVECGATDNLTLDHIYPWSLGGSDDFENLQTMCMSCNREKGANVE